MTEWTVPARVDRVIDGDTLAVTFDLGWHISYANHLRLARINAPELRTAEGPASREFMLGLCPEGSTVTAISHSIDKYGRALAEVISAGVNVSDAMVAAGMATPYP